MRSFLVSIVLAVAASTLAAQCRVVGTRGNGCGISAPFGIPWIACVGSPQLGNQGFGVDATTQMCASVPAAVLMVGQCRAAPLIIRGPYGQGGFCGPTEATCALFVEAAPLVLVPGVPRVGGFIFPLPVPNDPSLTGATLCTQEANLCTIQSFTCVAASHGLAIQIF